MKNSNIVDLKKRMVPNRKSKISIDAGEKNALNVISIYRLY